MEENLVSGIEAKKVFEILQKHFLVSEKCTVISVTQASYSEKKTMTFHTLGLTGLPTKSITVVC